MLIFSKIGQIIFLTGFVFFISGCSIASENVSNPPADITAEEDKTDDDEEKLSERGDNNLADEQKTKIDEWLEENGYNRYGDRGDIMYTGGTPLFDESTGEREDRFDYILKKHPDILEKIK